MKSIRNQNHSSMNNRNHLNAQQQQQKKKKRNQRGKNEKETISGIPLTVKSNHKNNDNKNLQIPSYHTSSIMSNKDVLKEHNRGVVTCQLISNRSWSFPIKNFSVNGSNDANENNNENRHPTGKEKAKFHTKVNHNNREKTMVLARLGKDLDISTVRLALDCNSKLPEKFKIAFSGTSLVLNSRREFTVVIKERTKMFRFQEKQMLQKNHLKGWLEWLQGRRGWVIDTNKSPYVQYYRDLHEVYDVKVRTLMKHVNEDAKKALRLLYYNENQQTLWKKASKTQSLHNAVGMIRPFLEVVKFFCTDSWEKWVSLPWLIPSLTLKQCKWRIERVTFHVQKLMHNSDWGPDSPVHWAAHPKLNSYPLTMVTSEMMTELVVGVANILSLLFLEKHDTKMGMSMNLKDVDDLLASPLWSSTAKLELNSGFSLSKKESFGDSNTKNSISSNNSKKMLTRSDSSKHHSIDDVVIDLTGLSICN